MSRPLDCPNMESWRVLSDGTLPPDKQESYARHLETCPACQDLFDRADDLGGELRRLGREIGDPTVAAADPTLNQFLARLREGTGPERPWLEPLELYFLGPPAH